MTARHRAPLSFLLVSLLAVAMTVTAALPASAAVEAPAAPWGLSAGAGVDGIGLSWFRGSTQTGGVPTAYVVHRRAPGYDADWVVNTATSSTSWSYQDRSAPTDVEVSYTVSARNSVGDSPESEPVTARVPRWDGPYDPDRVSLTLVWDEAAGGGYAQRSTVVANATTMPALTQTWDNGGVSFSAGAWTEALTLPRGVVDGSYAVGDGEGQLPLRVMAGDFCTSGGAAVSPGGVATVSRAAPSLGGFYASISVDAAFECGDGHRLRAELRWHTPDPIRLLTTPPTTVMTAAPGKSATTEVTVTNSGTEPVALGPARFVDADLSTAAPLTVVGSTCEGVTLPAGSTCTVTVRYDAGAAASREGRGVLALATDIGEWELGTVVGQQPAAYSGPQTFAGSTSPGRLDLSWSAPATMDSRLITGWRVEDVGGATPRTLQNIMVNYATATTLRAPDTGRHVLRVVMLTGDGREVPSSSITLTTASRWLLVTTPTGARAYDADGGVTNGGLFGRRTQTTDGIAVSPTRKSIIIADGPYDGWVRDVGATGDGFRGLTHDPLFADAEPDVSPDGTTVALLRRGYSGAQNRPSALITVPVTGGEPTVVPNTTGLSKPVWTHDGTALIASTETGPLVRVNPATGARTSIPGTTAAAAAAVSRTGRLAYALTGWGGSEQIRVTTLNGGTSTLVGTHPGATDLSWDPTGQWLAVTGAPYGDAPITQLFDMRTSTPIRVRQSPGGTSVSWLVPISAAPASSVTSPAWTTSTASLTVGATDPDDAPGGLRRECQLDGGAWKSCAAAWRLTGLAAGPHTAAARVTDPSGQVSSVARRSWSVDTQAPTVALNALPSVRTTTGLKLTWAGKDTGGSGFASVEMRYRSAPLGSAFGALAYPTGWRALKGTSLTTTLSAGRHYCFSIRARDTAGNTSAWTAERCTTMTLDDRSLTASTGWTRGSSSAYAYGTFSKAKSSGRTLTRPSVQGRRIALVATTCSTCGSVDVYHAGVKLGRVNLYSATTSYRQLRWLPLQSVTRTGSVVIRTTSSKPVYIDGVAAWH